MAARCSHSYEHQYDTLEYQILLERQRKARQQQLAQEEVSAAKYQILLNQ